MMSLDQRRRTSLHSAVEVLRQHVGAPPPSFMTCCSDRVKIIAANVNNASLETLTNAVLLLKPVECDGFNSMFIYRKLNSALALRRYIPHTAHDCLYSSHSSQKMDHMHILGRKTINT